MPQKFCVKIKIDNNKFIDTDLDHILFSKNNPRYTIIPNLNTNLMNFLCDMDKSQKEIIHDLISCEGDFSDFLKLINSIDKKGFKNNIEQIYVVKNQKNNSFVIAEGNRRILCVKLLLNLINIPEYWSLSNEKNNYSNEKTFKENENDWIDDNDPSKDKFHNYEEIKQIIKKTNLEKKYEPIVFTLIEKDNDLWNFIYDKHLSGEKIGIRKWSRSKYFADLLQWFGMKGFNHKWEEAANIENKINRESNTIEKDFKEAWFIFACFYFGLGRDNDKTDGNEINFIDNMDILNKISFSNKISALERTHSFNKIRLLLLNHWNIDKTYFEEKYLKIEYHKETNMIFFRPTKNYARKILCFIYKKWLNGEITTRPFKNEEKILHEILLILKNIVLSKKLNLDELNKIEEFDCSIDEIDTLLKSNDLPNIDIKIKEQLQRFKYAKHIKLNVDQIKKFFKNQYFRNIVQPKSVFKKLIYQLDWNLNNKEKYLNAVCASLRSFWEQIILWTYVSMTNGKSEQSKRMELIDTFSKNRTLDLFSNIRNEMNSEGEVNSAVIVDYLVFLGINKERDNFEKYLNFFIDLIRKKSNYYTVLCEGIHSLHRIYLNNNYLDSLKKIEYISELTNKISKEIKWKNYDKLNEEIMSKIRENNE